MTMTKRTQGRPPRNSGVNGREKLIEATRIYLQSNRKVSVTRTEIAQECGVTPALISYYFKDKQSLLDAVTKPLMRSYHARLATICSSQDSAAEQMCDIIRLLIQLNMEDGFLVEHLVRQKSLDELDAEDHATMESFHGAIIDLVEHLVADGTWRKVDPTLAELALWGICRAFGETLRLGARGLLSLAPEASDSYVTFVYQTFANPCPVPAPPASAA